MSRVGITRVLRLAADVLTVLTAIAIAYLTLSQSVGGKPFFISDKAAHAIAFFALVFPVSLAHRWGFLWIVPLAIGFGWAIEVIQPYFGRGREIEDFYADLIGIASGATAGTLIRMLRR
ncbi:MAG: VanZ family protein [Paracoccaceae bacterium]|nr:VanZ family protein [Paracoccaceae bacterium]